MHRDWHRLAWRIALIGSVGSLLVAWILDVGPRRDPGSVPLWWFGGPIASLGLAVTLMLVRGWLRRRIRPNGDDPFPFAPPFGTPAALIKNPKSGVLETADKVSGGRRFVGDWMVATPAFESLPAICCGCLGPPGKGAYRRALKETGLEMVLPLCFECDRRWTRREWSGYVLATLATVFACTLMLVSPGYEGAFAQAKVVVAGVVAVWIAARVVKARCGLVIVEVVDRSRGVVRLWFRNPSYRKRLTGAEVDPLA